MRITRLGAVIAERVLELRDGGEVRVRIGKPKPFPDDPNLNFYCPYQIVWVRSDGVRYAGGVDAIQAFSLALRMIGADLYTSEEYKTERLTWLGQRNLGFPVP